ATSPQAGRINSSSNHASWSRETILRHCERSVAIQGVKR
ncbi:MAG: hypothetical protein ACI9TB_002981, partial [Parasphingorhabdus sp.]